MSYTDDELIAIAEQVAPIVREVYVPHRSLGDVGGHYMPERRINIAAFREALEAAERRGRVARGAYDLHELRQAQARALEAAALELSTSTVRVDHIEGVRLAVDGLKRAANRIRRGEVTP